MPRHSDDRKTSSDVPAGSAGMRLQRFLAATGLGSRRKCEEYIVAGRVNVDGQVARDLGTRVVPGQEVRVDGELVRRDPPRYFVLNKPRGYLCTSSDPAGRPRAIDLLPPSKLRLFTVGRLDESSEGLILLTNDGELAHRLAHPRFQVPRTYALQVAGRPTPETFAALKEGLYFQEGRFQVRWVKRIGTKGNSTFLQVGLSHGQNREIRRLFARVGHKVMRLRRVAFGPLTLGRLTEGHFRPLTNSELSSLRELASPKRRRGRERSPDKLPRRARRGWFPLASALERWQQTSGLASTNSAGASDRINTARIDRQRAKIPGRSDSHRFRERSAALAVAPPQLKAQAAAATVLPTFAHSTKARAATGNVAKDMPDSVSPHAPLSPGPSQSSRLPGQNAATLQQRVRVLAQRQLARDTYALALETPQIASAILPGQFFMVRAVGTVEPLFGRPFALYDTVMADGQPVGVEFGYAVIGKLTGLMPTWRPGNLVEIWGPLGNGFPPPSGDHLMLVAGGIGQTPFLAVAREALGLRNYGQPPRILSRRPRKVTCCYGVRSAEYLAGLDDFALPGLEMRLAADDGSRGHRGFVTELLTQSLAGADRPDCVYCCGPEPMMHAAAQICDAAGVPCWLSLETPMACGFGACFSCVTAVRMENGGWDYRRTCVEGPVFPAERLVL